MNNRELTLPEFLCLKDSFLSCAPVREDDEELHEFGRHRNLYDCITGFLRIDCKPTRGAAYKLAADLLRSNAALNFYPHSEMDVARMLLTMSERIAELDRRLETVEQGYRNE